MKDMEEISKAICNAITEVTGVVSLDKDASLISRDSGIAPASFLYIFDILEKQLQIPVHDIFKTHTFEVMTTDGLTAAIYNLNMQKQ